MQNISKKVHDLENCVFDEKNIDLSTTRIAYECLSEPEQKIMDQAEKILHNWDRKRSLTETERTVLDKAYQIVNARIYYLFHLNLSSLLCGDNALLKFVVSTRLLWFLDELTKHVDFLKEEQRLIKKEGTECQLDELHKKWKDPYTKESFTEFLKPVLKNVLKD